MFKKIDLHKKIEMRNILTHTYTQHTHTHTLLSSIIACFEIYDVAK